jgi:DNA-binding transcriptional LysR family regulator
VNPHLEWQPLIEEELVLIVPRAHRLAKRQAVPLRELAGEPFVAFKPGTAMRELTDELCRQAGFTPRITFESEETGTVRGFVAAGLGVALVPAGSGRAAGLVGLRISEPTSRRTIGIAWIRDRYLPSAALAFRGFVIERLGGELAGATSCSCADR